MKSCFFIGHRSAPPEIHAKLEGTIERHISAYGVAEFIVGHYGAFDRMAQGVLKRATEQYPQIQLLLLLPYHPAEHRIEVPGGFNTCYPLGMETVPQQFAIARAKKIVISSVDYLICYDAGHITSSLIYETTPDLRRDQGWFVSCQALFFGVSLV